MPELKKRHGCLTAWLILMIVANSTIALGYCLIGVDRSMYFIKLKESYPNAPDWTFPLLALLSLINLACSIALFKWKKWGFWGFCVTSVIVLIINLSVGVKLFPSSLGGLFGIVLLYGVLHIGKEDKGWPQLE
jgi:cytochrome bd-type quinol oxidase subunit 2